MLQQKFGNIFENKKAAKELTSTALYLHLPRLFTLPFQKEA